MKIAIKLIKIAWKEYGIDANHVGDQKVAGAHGITCRVFYILLICLSSQSYSDHA